MLVRGGIERGLVKDLNRQLWGSDGDYQPILEANRGRLIDLAAEASKSSPHYDGITHFGGATLALAESVTNGPYFILVPSCNSSPFPGAPKSCAEMTADAVTRWSYRKLGGAIIVVSMTIFGPSDPDRIRSIAGTDAYPQCPPCHDCIGRLVDNPAFMYDTETTLANSLGSSVHELGVLVNHAAMVARPTASGEVVGCPPGLIAA